MREKDLAKLEFFQFIELIKEHTHSKATERYLQDVRPIKDAQTLQREISLVEDFMAVSDRITLYSFDDLEEVIKKTAIQDYVLSVEECLSLLKVLKLIREVRRYIGDAVSEHPALAGLTKNLYLFGGLESAIEANIDLRGFVKDSASEELRRIRQAIRDTEKEVLKRLESLFTRPDADKVFSDKFVAYKNGRYVLPVKTSEVKKIIGVVHGTSSSGFTTYVEPQSVIELNNRLAVLREEEDHEVRRVLKRLTSLIGEQHKKLLEAFKTLVKVDYLYALSRLSKAYGGKFPKLGSKVELRGARHPLLSLLRGDAVPVDILVNRGLLLTGPNTGGKTVALKTLGLCSLLFQCAIPIPIEDGELPLFEHVFVDLGDEQSLQQNLSTFSAHMSNIAEFLPHVNDRTLVLLDELGSGTDPVEGSALGIALLEYLKSKGAFVFANTHHTPVKVYALQSDYYTPASVLFDKESLEPLYRIVYNSVGESMALVVAQRCGIPQEIIDMAKEKLPEGFVEYFSARESLEAYIKEYEQKKRELEVEKEKLHLLIQEQERRLRELEEEKRREIKAELQKIRERFEEFIKHAEAKLTSQREKQKLKKLFEEQFQSFAEREETINIGDWVEFMGSRGKVLEVKEDKAQVAFGSVKAWLKLKELKKVEPPPELQRSVVERFIDFKKGTPYEINLTGLTVEEALTKLELFLEEAYSMGAKVVKVIHGYGTLKKAVFDFLSSSSLVVFHREGYPKEGGAGTTLVYLRKD